VVDGVQHADRVTEGVAAHIDRVRVIANRIGHD
jgi:hypothetical protein